MTTDSTIKAVEALIILLIFIQIKISKAHIWQLCFIISQLNLSTQSVKNFPFYFNKSNPYQQAFMHVIVAVAKLILSFINLLSKPLLVD